MTAEPIIPAPVAPTREELIEAAHEYHRKGFEPVPVAADKIPAITGVTGYNGIPLKKEELEAAFSGEGVVAIGVRLSGDLIGIDVDQYDEKEGFTNLAAFRREHDLPKLPDTLVTTSRERPSGIRLYYIPRDPEGARIKLKTAPVEGVDIVQHHHRYAMAWPSIHPRTGRAYQWVSGDGELLEDIPFQEDLFIAPLPTAWVRALEDTREATPEHAPVEWANPNATAEPMDPDIREMLDRAMTMDPGGRHDGTLRYLGALWRYDQEQRFGTRTAMAELGAWFINAVADTRGGRDKAAHEWNSMTESARRYIATHEPRPDTFDGKKADTEKGATVNPATPWEDPVPLDGPPPPPFPVDALGAVGAALARAAAREVQMPADLPAMGVLGAVSAITLGKIEARIDAGRTQSTNLYLLAIGEPGLGKSPAFSFAMAPVQELERTQAQEASQAISENRAQRKQLEKQLAQAVKDDAQREQVRLLMELDELPELHRPRITAVDITIEGLGKVMGQQNGRITVAASEGDFFGNLDRYKPETAAANLGPILEGWSGGELKVDRKGEPDPLIIPNAYLGLCLMAQPETVRRLLRNRYFVERGLADRIMYSAPPSTVGRRNYLEPIEPDLVARRDWADLIEREGKRWAKNLHPKRIDVSSDAMRAWRTFRQELEERCNDDLAHLRGWVTKLGDAIIRTAALLWVLDGGRDPEITLEQMERALEIGRYWVAHRIAVAEASGQDPRLEAAKTALEAAQRIAREGDPDHPITPREVQRRKRTRFASADEAREGLDLLEELGYIRCIARPRADRPIYELHPEHR